MTQTSTSKRPNRIAKEQLHAASGDMYKMLKKVREHFLQSGCGPGEWMDKRLNEINALFEKHNLL